jgi:hypothetical protein
MASFACTAAHARSTNREYLYVILTSSDARGCRIGCAQNTLLLKRHTQALPQARFCHNSGYTVDALALAGVQIPDIPSDGDAGGH